MRDTREMAEAKTADAEERERRLGSALSELQGARAKVEKEAAEESEAPAEAAAPFEMPKFELPKDLSLPKLPEGFELPKLPNPFE